MFLSFFYLLAEGPGVTQRKKKHFEKKKVEIFFCLRHPPDNREFPLTISAHSVQPFGRLYATYLYIYMNVLFYYTDIFTFTKILFEQGFDTMCRKGWPYRYTIGHS